MWLTKSLMAQTPLISPASYPTFLHSLGLAQGDRALAHAAPSALIHVTCPFNSCLFFRAQARPLEASTASSVSNHIPPYRALILVSDSISISAFTQLSLISSLGCPLHEDRDQICGLVTGVSPAPHSIPGT